MNDLNFFDFYIEKREFKINKLIIISLLACILCFTFLVYGIRNQIKINRLSSQIESLKTISEDPDILNRVDDIKNQQEEVHRFKEEVDDIRKFDSLISMEDNIDDNLLRMITYSMPESMFFNSINIEDTEIYIQGISQDELSIAEFAKGVEFVENVEDVFISNIAKEEENYYFDLNITLRGVIEDGEDQ